LRHKVVFETLVREDMTPMARRVADTEKNHLVLCLGSLDDLWSPFLPLDAPKKEKEFSRPGGKLVKTLTATGLFLCCSKYGDLALSKALVRGGSSVAFPFA
jgi:hypothetical protein